MIRACIFDLDGVIVDTAHYHYLAWKRLAGELGHNLTLEENERLKGVSRRQSMDIVLELAKASLTEDEVQLLTDRKNRWFNEYVDQMTPDEVFPGVLELLRKIRESGMYTGLASSSRNAQTVLRQLGISSLFDAIVDGTMIRNTKPDPEIFLLTARALLVDPSVCVVIEDAEAGVEAALSAGMKCIGVGSTRQLGRANRVVEKTADISLSMIQELKQ